MLTTMTKTLMTALFGITMLSAGSAQAAPEGAEGPAKIGAKVCQRLACTDAQKVELKKIREQTAPKIKAEREAIKALRGEIAAEFRKDRLDNSRLSGLYTQLDARKKTIAGLRRGAMAQVHAVLTPAQRQQLGEMLERRAQHGKGRGHGRGHGGGKRGR